MSGVREPKHTPGPWDMGGIDEWGGYDAMTAGLEVGPVVLDGCEYGQERNKSLTDEQRDRMLADAHLIAAAPELLEALKSALNIVAEFMLVSEEIYPTKERVAKVLDRVKPDSDVGKLVAVMRKAEGRE